MNQVNARRARLQLSSGGYTISGCNQPTRSTQPWGHTLEVPVVIRLTCDCAVADDAVMPIRAESSS